MTLLLNMRPPSRPGYHWVAAWNCDGCQRIATLDSRVLWDARLDTNGRPLGVLLACGEDCERQFRADLVVIGEWMTMPLAIFLAQVALTSGVLTETSNELERMTFGQFTASSTDTLQPGGTEPS